MKKQSKKTVKPSGKKKLPGYPNYPAGEDIYKNYDAMGELNPDDLYSRKEPNLRANEPNEKDFRYSKTGGDLDIPGSELDDKLEDIGEEDEENNYYSLGGDNHNDLEEDRAD